MRKNRNKLVTSAEDWPQALVKLLEQRPDLAGAGVSTKPQDNIWTGYDGKFDIDAALAIDRDPKEALAQIIMEIVSCYSGAGLVDDKETRVSGAVATILGKKAPTGVKPGKTDRPNKRIVLQRAAFLVYKRRLNSDLGKSDWKTCIWDALTPRQAQSIFKNERDGDKFTNFYNECMKLIRKKGQEERLLFWASVHEQETGEANLVQWMWRQSTINRVIRDLTALGIIKPQRDDRAIEA